MLTDWSAMARWANALSLWGGAVLELIKALAKTLSKDARKAFKAAVMAMVMRGSIIRTSKMVLVVHEGVTNVSVRRTTKKVYPMAWRERLDTLRGLLPSFESVVESETKNRGTKGNKNYSEGITSRRRVDRRPIITLGPDDDPVIGIRQSDRGPWLIIDGNQIRTPMQGEFVIEWRLIFLSGRVAISKVTIKDGKPVKFVARKTDQLWFAELKPRMLEYIKFGTPYELDYPVLLVPEQIEELKGLMAAEKVAEYLDITKSSKGKQRRGSKDNPFAKEPTTEEDLFRDRRAAKAIQKRTNRSPEEGIGEYAGGYDADPGFDVEDEPRTWPSLEDRALGREHPARHFRISLFNRWDKVANKRVFEAGPVRVNYKDLSISRGVTPDKFFEWDIEDFKGLKERILQELEHGDLLFWAESYTGQYAYAYERLGIRYSQTYKADNPRLPCKQCGHKTWRYDLHAQVCDHCGSEAFPRNWLNILIPINRLSEFCTYDKGATHLQVRLYGKAVKWVIEGAWARGLDITQIQREERLRGEETKIKKVLMPIGLGRLIWGPDKPYESKPQPEPKWDYLPGIGYSHEPVIEKRPLDEHGWLPFPQDNR